MRHRGDRRIARVGMLLTAVALASAPAIAADEAAEATAEATGEEEGSRISGIIQIDFTNAYFFRGIMNERDGFIAQPWGELYFNLFSADEGLIRDVTIGGGVWNSWHSEKTLRAHHPGPLYETDWYPLLSVEFPYGITWTTIYYFYSSPNGAFDTVEELNLKLAWDDSEVLGRFALAPWLNLAVETHLTSFGPDEGTGLQLGVAPTLYELDNDEFPLSVTLPAELGLALEDYYEEDHDSENTFGYANVGLLASLPITAIPESFGTWTVSAGGKIFFLSDTLQDVNRGDHVYPVVTASLGVEF
ncbi:MAG: hypothetical protein L0027_14580 [Candidatus Rokubacteria bacterium]|nr:hypothetical protein [Candidatus Rokubacteria bacterium]